MSDFVLKGDPIPEDAGMSEENETAAEVALDKMPEEVAARTADTDAEEASTYRKEFLIGAPWDEEHDYESDDHEANMAATVQDAINAGLRVVGDVVFVGAAPEGVYGRRGQQSILLTYEAPAVPAHLVGAGATEETSDIAASMEDVTSPRDILLGDDTSAESDKKAQEDGAKHAADGNDDSEEETV